MSELSETMRRFLQASLTMVASVIVGLGLCEVGLRVLDISYPVFVAYDHERAFSLRPGKSGWYENEGRAYVAINSLGYRDIEHSVEKPVDVIRIAFLGDSFTEADQVDVSETYWKRTERLLEADARLAGKHLEVLNFGVAGYGTSQELLTLRKHVLSFSPDIVILAIFPGNDLVNNSKQLSQSGAWRDDFRPYHVFREGELTLDTSFRDFTRPYLMNRLLLETIHYSRVFELVNQVRRSLATRQLSKSRYDNPEEPTEEVSTWNEIYFPPTEESWRDAWNVTEELIRVIHSEVAAVGAEFLLVTLTTALQVDPDPKIRDRIGASLGLSDFFYPEHRLRQLGERYGFPVVTLAERMQGEAVAQNVYFHGFANNRIGQGHWNQAGHEIASRILSEELLDLGILAGDRANDGTISRAR